MFQISHKNVICRGSFITYVQSILKGIVPSRKFPKFLTALKKFKNFKKRSRLDSSPTQPTQKCRISRSEMFSKKGVLKIFAIFTGKHLYWCLFLTTLLKRDSNTGVFL